MPIAGMCANRRHARHVLRAWDAGLVAAQLLRDGCACVLIVWDLRPAWPDMRSKPCRNIDAVPEEIVALVSMIVTVNAWNTVGVSTRPWEPGSYEA